MSAERDSAPLPKLCPNCSYVLRAENVRLPPPAPGDLAIEVAYWLVLALILGLLWSTRTAEDLQLALGVGAIAVWFYLRARRRAAAARREAQEAGRRAPETVRYYCPNCLRRYGGEELRER